MREPRELPISPHLAEMLITLDEFLRSRDLPVSELFTHFLAARGSNHPRFGAYNFIDQLSFTTLRCRPHDAQSPGSPKNAENRADMAWLLMSMFEVV